MKARLLDVSSCNGPISYAAIAAAGISGIIARATLGTTVDAMFQRHRAGARAAKLHFGAYGVLTPGGSVLAQATAYIAAVGHLDPRDIPPVIDFETSGDFPNDAETWCSYVEQALQRRCGLYSYRSFLSGALVPPAHPLRSRWLWLADYESAAHVPAGWPEPTLWQCYGDVGVASTATAFGETGIAGARLDGTGAHVDRSYFNGSADDLQAWIDLMGLAQMPPPSWQPDGPAHAIGDADRAEQRISDTEPAPPPGLDDATVVA